MCWRAPDQGNLHHSPLPRVAAPLSQLYTTVVQIRGGSQSEHRILLQFITRGAAMGNKAKLSVRDASYRSHTLESSHLPTKERGAYSLLGPTTPIGPYRAVAMYMRE